MQPPVTNPDGADDAAFPFDPNELASALARNRWLILGAIVGVTGLVVFLTLRQHKVYEATTTLEYDPDPPRPLGSETAEVVEEASNFWATKEFYKTQNRILTSRTIGERVVRKLDLHRNAGFMAIPVEDRDAWQGAAVEEAAELLKTRVSVEQQADSRIVELRVRGRSPARATLIANTLADVYIEKTLEDRLGTTVNALDWLSTQLDDLRSELDISEHALHEFKEEHNILSVSLQDRQNILSSTIEQLNEALTRSRTRRIELQARVAQIRKANDEDPMEVHSSLVDQNLSVQQLRARYREKSAELSAESVAYGENHPKIVRLNSELGAIRADLRDAIDGLITAVEADLAEVRATEIGLQAALDEANQAGLDLNLLEIEYMRLSRERENKANLYSILLERTAKTNLSKLARVANARVVDRALEPDAHIAPRLSVNLALGLLGGLVFGLSLAILRTRLDRSLRNVEDAEKLGLTVLGLLPKIDDKRGVGRAVPYRANKRSKAGDDRDTGDASKDLMVHQEPQSAVAECARSIRTNVTFMSVDSPLKAIVLTSPMPREGKTTVAISLATSMAQSGVRVLLVDTDLRRPRLHRALNVSSSIGVTSVLVGDTSLEQAIQDTAVPGLSLLPCGPLPPNPSELLHSSRFTRLVQESRELFDLVVFDSPPVGAVTDAAIIAPQLDGVIVVMRAGTTTRESLRGAIRKLLDVGSFLVGGVLNDVDLSSRNSGYEYYYHYYQAEGRNGGDVDEGRASAAE
jgi:capsular exopolysaccharide synthesis family protein